MAGEAKSPAPTNLPAWVVAAAALVGSLLYGVSRPGEGKAPPAKPAAEAPGDAEAAPPPAPSPAEEPDPLVVLRDLHRFGAARPEGDGEGPAAPAWGGVLGRLFPAGRKAAPRVAEVLRVNPAARYEFAVATVPDPVDSKFALEFDAVLEALQRAFEARGFLLQSSWLPWPRPGDRRPASASAKGKPAYREYPGTLLFRSSVNASATAQTFALVCLVGENPSSGIHKAAMTRALDIYAQLDAALRPVGTGPYWSDEQPATAIPIVGPYYTGYQAALKLTLTAWAQSTGRYRAGAPAFRVISGSATAVRPALFDEGPADATFQATVVPNRLVLHGMLHYLTGSRADALPARDPTGLAGPIAFLRETNTGFGAHVLDPGTDAKGADAGATYDAMMGVSADAIDLPFPASVSQLQLDLDGLEAGASPLPALPPADAIGPRLPARNVPQLDGINPFDRASAAAVAGQALRAILTAIDRERVRYVGIAATDGRDIVFLNKLLRKNCPNVRVFSTEPSVAFLQPDDGYHMRGMLVGSTYPLYPAAQKWAGPVERGDASNRTRANGPADSGERRWNARIAFPTQGAQGYYNAALAQFGDCGAMLGYRSPFSGGPGARPPIWISVVGQGGTLVPVHAFSTYDDLRPPAGEGRPATEYVFRAAGRDGRPLPDTAPPPVLDVPPSAAVAHLAAAGLLALAILPLLRHWGGALPAGAPWERLCGGTASGGRRGPVPFVWFWRFVLLSGALLFALPHALAAREIVRPCCLSDDGTGPACVAVACLVLLEALALVGLLAARAARPHPGERRYGYAGLALFALAAVGASFGQWLRCGPTERFFFYARAADIGSGLSPAVPMALLAAATLAFGWNSLRQADLSRMPWLGCPYPVEWAKLRAADDAARAAFRHPIWLVPASAAVVAAIAAVGAAAAYRRLVELPSGERHGWDTAMMSVLFALSGAVALSVVRLVEMWRALSRLLGEFHRVPMARRFGQLPDAVGRAFNVYLFSKRPHFRHLILAVWALPPDRRGALRDAVAVSRPHLNWLFARPEAPVPAGASREGDLACLAGWLTDESRGYFLELAGAWDGRTLDGAFGHGRAGAEAAGAGAAGPAEPAAPAADATPRVEAREAFAATAVVLYLGTYLAQLRLLAGALAFTAPLLLFAVAAYPFLPDRPLLDFQAALLAAVAGGIAYVLVRINADGFLGRVARSDSGSIAPDAGFLGSMGAYVLPLLGVLFAQVFGLFRVVFEPIFGLLR